jgi:hypothetical protein
MAISQISMNSVATNPAYTNPYAKTEQQTAVPQVKQDAMKSPQAAKTDTVTISQQALQKANQDQNGQEQTNKNPDSLTAQAKQRYQYPNIRQAA